MVTGRTRRQSGNTDGPSALEFGLATTRRDADGAFRLVHDQYVARGYMRPAPSGRRVTVYHTLPRTKIFVARDGERIVGTVSLVRDGRQRMPCDALYPRELHAMRAAGVRLAEVTSLAVNAGSDAEGFPILRALVQTLAIYATRLADVDALCITVHPRHARFYERLLGFERFGTMTAYGAVNGAPAVGLTLDLARELARATTSGPSFAADLVDDREMSRVLATLVRDARASTLTSADLADLFVSSTSGVSTDVRPQAVQQLQHA